MDITQFERRPNAADYIAGYRDAPRFEILCRQCPRYNTTWHCPPYDFSTLEAVSQYRHVHLFATKVSLTPQERQQDTAALYPQVMQRVWDITHPQLMRLEAQYPGSLTFGMACRLCGDAPCTRTKGLPCRHPDQMRHSIESFGFDMAKTAQDIFGIPMLWGKDGQAPEYLIFITALFTNHDMPNSQTTPQT